MQKDLPERLLRISLILTFLNKLFLFTLLRTIFCSESHILIAICWYFDATQHSSVFWKKTCFYRLWYMMQYKKWPFLKLYSRCYKEMMIFQTRKHSLREKYLSRAHKKHETVQIIAVNLVLIFKQNTLRQQTEFADTNASCFYTQNKLINKKTLWVSDKWVPLDCIKYTIKWEIFAECGTKLKRE